MFPASIRLDEALTQYTTTYVHTRSKLGPFVQLVQDKINGLEFKRFVLHRRVALNDGTSLVCSSGVIAFGSNSRGTDETWCIDTRGVLTLAIDSVTYQKLGLLGKPLPWRPHQNRYSTCIPFPFSLLSWKVPNSFV